MTKIRQPPSPPVSETPAETPATKSAKKKSSRTTRRKSAEDKLAAAPEATSGAAPLQDVLKLHLPVPPNLRPIRTRVPDAISSAPLTHSLLAQAFARASPAEGGQAAAVANGALGLVNLHDAPAPAHSGPWASPLENPFDDVGVLSAGAQHTMATLARIDRHLGIWAALLGVDADLL